MLLNKNEILRASPVYIGYLILRELKNKDDRRIALPELASRIRGQMEMLSHRQLVFALMLLFQSGVVDFSEPYVEVK